MKVFLLALITWIALLTCAACSSGASTGNAEGSQSNENTGSSSLAFSSAYQISWSGNATLPAGCPATCGTPAGTCICGTQTSACIGGPGWGDKNFTDTSPPNAVVTAVHLDIQEIGCGGGTVSAFLNGTKVGAYQPTAVCACGACDPQQTVDSLRFANGIPGYHYGGVNTLHLETLSGSPCIARVDIRTDGTTARLGVTPAAYTFASQRVGSTSAAQSFTVQNQGTEALTVNSFDTSGPFDIDSATSTPFTLAAGQTSAVTVTFSPVGSGAASGSLTVASTDPRGPVLVALSGNGAAPSVDTSPNPKDFGPLAIGASATGTVTITNTGNDTLSISNIALSGSNAADFSLLSPPTAPRIPAGQSLPLTVRFAPSNHGIHSADIVITSDAAGGATFRSSLSGTGQGPEMEVASTSVDFGGANVNTDAAPKTVGVRNTGETSLRIASVSFSNSDFGTSTAFPLDVAPGARGEIALTFRPSVIGARTGNVVLTSNDPLNPTAQIELAGEGTSPSLSVTPSSVDFGDVRTGSVPVEKTVTIANTGTGPLVISRAVVGGTDAARFSLAAVTLPLTIGAGEQSTLTVSYAPNAVGANAATLTIDSNDATSASVVVPLSGKGVSSAVSLQPSTLDFGGQLVGRTSAVRTAEITNTGSAPLNITALTLGGPQSAMFALTNAPELPAIVAPSSKLSLTFTFTPSAMGNAAGELSVVSDAADTPSVLLALKGSAVSQLLAVTPTSLDFGIVKVGAKPAAKTVTITNTGGDSISLTAGTLEGAQAASFTISSLAGPLEPGKTATVNVTYTANAAVDAKATLKIGAADTAIPKAQVALQGRAVSQLLTSDVSSLDFGRVNVGDKPPPKEITIKNQSSTALDIASIVVDSDQFTVGGAPTQLAAGASGTFTVSFLPTKQGTPSGTVRVTLPGASTEELAIPVSGNAASSSNPPPVDAGNSNIYGGGCGCGSTAASSSGTSSGIGAALGLACLVLLRRRSAGRRAKR